MTIKNIGVTETDEQYYDEIYAGKHRDKIDWDKCSLWDIVDIVTDRQASPKDLDMLGYLVNASLGMKVARLPGLERYEYFIDCQEVMDFIYGEAA